MMMNSPIPTVPKKTGILGLGSLALLLLGSTVQPSEGHVMLAASPFNALARPDRTLGRLTRMMDELVSDNNLIPPTVLPLWRKVMQHQTTDMSQHEPIPGTISAFRADAVETEQTYVISADLPGVKRDHIRIAFLQDGVLSITAERHSPFESTTTATNPSKPTLTATPTADDGKDKNNNQIEVSKGDATDGTTWPKHLMREVVYGKSTRSFKLPPDADADTTTASFENGVLVISMKKRQAPKEKLVQIK